MYDNLHDAQKYLGGSIIRVSGHPVMVREVMNGEKGLRGTAYKLQDAQAILFNLDDKTVDYSPVPLGYGKDPHGRATYLFRNPARMWKQGLHDDNLGQIGGGRFAIRHPQYWVPLAKVIAGENNKDDDYLVRGGIVNRQTFIDSDRNIHFKGTHVGRVYRRKMILNEEFFFLREYLEENLYENRG